MSSSQPNSRGPEAIPSDLARTVSWLIVWLIVLSPAAGCGTTSSSPARGSSGGSGSGGASAGNSSWSRFGKYAIGATVWGKRSGKPMRHPARDLVADWLLQGNVDHRSWQLCPLDDGGDDKRTVGLAIVGRKNNIYVRRSRSGKTALEREPFTLNRLSPDGMITFLSPRATRSNPKAALAELDLTVGPLIYMTPQFLLYGATKPKGALVLQCLMPGGDEYAVVVFDQIKHWQLTRYIQTGSISQGKFPWPDVMPKHTVYTHEARSDAGMPAEALAGALTKEQQATLEAGLAAVKRGPNPNAIAELGLAMTIKEFAETRVTGVLGRHIGQEYPSRIDLEFVPDREPEWHKRYAEGTVYAVTCRPGTDLEWILPLGATDGFVGVLNPERFPTAGAALAAIGAESAGLHSVGPSSVIVKTTRPDVFLVAARAGRSATSLIGPDRLALLVIDPDNDDVNRTLLDKGKTLWKSDQPVAEQGRRLGRRELVSLIAAEAVMPKILGPTVAELKPIYESRTKTLQSLVKSSPLLEALVARAAVSETFDLSFKTNKDRRRNVYIGLDGRPLPGLDVSAVVESKLRKYKHFAWLTPEAFRRAFKSGEEAKKRGAMATAAAIALLFAESEYPKGIIPSNLPGWQWAAQFLIENAAVMADSKQRRALSKVMPPAARHGDLALNRFAKEFGAENILDVRFTVGEWQLERFEPVTTWRAPIFGVAWDARLTRTVTMADEDGRSLKRTQTYEGRYGWKAQTVEGDTAKDPRHRPAGAKAALDKLRAGRETALKAIKKRLDKDLEPLQARMLRDATGEILPDPRKQPKPEGWTDAQWCEERAWMAWWLGLEPAPDEALILQFSAELPF